MQSRMDRYNNSQANISRDEANKEKYKNLEHTAIDDNYNLSDNVIYINNNEDLNKLVNSKDAFNKLKRMNDKSKLYEEVVEIKEEVPDEEKTIYDINLYLDIAGTNKEKYIVKETKEPIEDTLDLFQSDTFYSTSVMETQNETLEPKETLSSSTIQNLIDNVEETKKSSTGKLNEEIMNTQVLSPTIINKKEDYNDNLLADFMIESKEEKNIPKEETKISLKEDTLPKDVIVEEKEEKLKDTFYDGTLSFDKKDFNKMNKQNKKIITIISIILIILIIGGVVAFVVLDSMS